MRRFLSNYFDLLFETQCSRFCIYVPRLPKRLLLWCTGVDSCEQFWLAGRRVEQSSISPFVWTFPSMEKCGCDTESWPISLGFSNWAPGEPDNAGDKSSVREACLAMMKTASPHTKSWYDVDCGERICAICEYHAPFDGGNSPS